MNRKNIVVVALLILAIVGFAMIIFGIIIGLTLSYWGTLLILVGAILLGLITAYLIFSFTIVRLDEVGASEDLGRPMGDTESDWYFTPYGIRRVLKESSEVFELEIPSDPDKIYRGDGEVPEGKFPPLRMKFAKPEPKEGEAPAEDDNPYNISMVLEVAPVVRWRIASYTAFRRRFGSKNGLEKCRITLEDKAVVVVGNKLVGMSPEKVNSTLSATDREMTTTLGEEFNAVRDGIEIVSLSIKPLAYPHGLNTSVVGVAISGQEKKSAILTAEGDKQKEILRAEGAATAKNLDTAAEENRLIRLGRLKDGIPQPDGNVRVNAEAIGKHKGALVFGSGATPVFSIDGKEDGK